ncbi:MAG TPA: hypothetical protein VK474_06220, partial [Chthoniobacterales bacterium]|nr:hypothetical protein [Chthoniobacterales bacterium]
MAQNLVSLNLSDADFTALAGALDTIRTTLGDRAVSLSPKQRQTLVKMGDNTRTFCEQTVRALQANSSSLPGDFPMAELSQDMVDYDPFAAFVSSFAQVGELLTDTQKALASDIMTNRILGAGGLKFANKISP